MKKRGNWKKEKPAWWPDSVLFRSPNTRDPALPCSSMSTGEMDEVLEHCLMFVNSLTGGDVNMDDDEDAGDGFDTDVDSGHINNSDVHMGGDGNNYIGDDNDRLSVIEDSLAINEGNGTVGDGGTAEGDLGNTSTVPSSISKSIVCGADYNCCVIIDGESLVTGSTDDRAVRCFSCHRLFHTCCVVKDPNEIFGEKWECGCRISFDALKRSQYFSLHPLYF